MSSSALAATGKTAEGWDQPGTKLPSATASVQNSLICPAFPPHRMSEPLGSQETVPGGLAHEAHLPAPAMSSSLWTPPGGRVFSEDVGWQRAASSSYLHMQPQDTLLLPSLLPKGWDKPQCIPARPRSPPVNTFPAQGHWPNFRNTASNLSHCRGLQAQDPFAKRHSTCAMPTGLDPGLINSFVMHERPCHLETSGGLDASRVLIYQSPYDGLSTKE